MSSYGKQRKNVKVRRVEGERRPSQSEEFGGGQERGSLSVDSSSRQEKEVDQPLVLIEWVDSFGCSASWQTINVESVSPLVCRSVGWLVYESGDCKVIVPHVTDKDSSIAQQGCGDMTIPTKAILRVVRLKPEERLATDT